MFNKLVQVVMLGSSNEGVAHSTCSATKIRRRRDEWIQHRIFAMLEQICMDAYNKMIGLELGAARWAGVS